MFCLAYGVSANVSVANAADTLALKKGHSITVNGAALRVSNLGSGFFSFSVTIRTMGTVN